MTNLVFRSAKPLPRVTFWTIETSWNCFVDNSKSLDSLDAYFMKEFTISIFEELCFLCKILTGILACFSLTSYPSKVVEKKWKKKYHLGPTHFPSATII